MRTLETFYRLVILLFPFITAAIFISIVIVASSHDIKKLEDEVKQLKKEKEVMVKMCQSLGESNGRK